MVLEEGGRREKWTGAREGGEAFVLETRADGKPRHGIRDCISTLHLNISVGLHAYSLQVCDECVSL